MIDALINAIWQWIAWIADNVINWLMSTVDRLVRGLEDMFATVYTWFQEVFAAIFNYLETALTKIVTFFETILQGISDFAARVWEAFEGLTTDVIDAIQNFIEDAWSSIRTAVETLLEDALTWIGSVADNVLRLIDQGIEAVVSVADQVKTTIIGWIDEVIQVAVKGYQEMVIGFNKALEGFLGGAGSFIAAIESRLSELKIAFADAATEVVAGFTGAAEDTLGPIRDKIAEVVESLMPDKDPKVAVAFVEEAKKITDRNASPQEMRQFVSNYWMKLDLEKGFWAQLFFTILGIMGGVLLIAQITGVSAQVMLQDYGKEFPYQLLPATDVTAAWRRGFVTEDSAIETIRRHGFSEQNAKIILNLSQQVPQEGDLLQLFHRGLISEDELNKAFLQKGYTENYREQLKTASYLIPPVNDLITMAVREAFTPEIAERFGQYEDFPEDLAEWAAKQGLTVEWARRYWAAHWALPSPLQGFEMLHRGVIKEPDLDLLLRALDVMPFWRDRLVQIAYTPFTRIDIRRMHRMGVLTEEDVLRSYKDLGYDEAKAKTMTDFVILLNAPASADDETALKELSRSSVVNFYSDGLIDKPRAVTLLTAMGYSLDGATLYLDSADLDAERRERKEEVSLTIALAEAGVITFEAAEDRLRKIGLETFEINKAIVSLIRKQERTTKLPTRAESEKMMKLGIITMEEYKELLKVFGYSEKWTDAFAKLAVSVA